MECAKHSLTYSPFSRTVGLRLYSDRTLKREKKETIVKHAQYGDIGVITCEDRPWAPETLDTMPSELPALFSGSSAGEICYLLIESMALASMILEERPPLNDILAATLERVGRFTFTFLGTSGPSLTRARLIEEIKTIGHSSSTEQLPDREYGCTSIFKVERAA